MSSQVVKKNKIKKQIRVQFNPEHIINQQETLLMRWNRPSQNSLRDSESLAAAVILSPREQIESTSIDTVSRHLIQF